ncbi:M14 family metallopeptidase [Undibacterium squillarum]|uniref:M14 family metallopeptidase n=1 Tax=Undibacterium squillarum TaxID=1131567 RepID=UPI0035B3D789
MMMHKLLPAALACLFAVPAAQAAENMVTLAEKSQFTKTGRYTEVDTLCKNFQKNYPKWVRCQEIGRSPEGRPILVLIATKTGALTPLTAKEKQIPVTLLQGGIHAGEIDGKDAGFLVLRELFENPSSDVLDKQVVMFVPVFNVDGHERFGKWNRPNQRGPEEMGWRTSAQNANLNRDYAKADTPEMQAMLRMVNQWDPLVTVDLHVTDGAKFEHDVSVQVEPKHAGDEKLRTAGQLLQQAVLQDLSKASSLPQPFYMSFNQEDDPMSGFTDEVPGARFSNGYFMLRNRFGILVETHSWKDYATRVRTTRNTLHSVLNQVAQQGAQWKKLAEEADQQAMRMAGKDVPVSYRTTDAYKTIEFRGYAYTRTQSDISGALMTRYDESKPQIWRVKLRDQNVPDKLARLPEGGYVVPAAWAKMVVEKLRAHGIQFQALTSGWKDVSVERFQTEKASFRPTSYEGRQPLEVKGQWVADQKLQFARGSIFIPSAQPKSALVATLFDPASADSLLSWGLFNQAFERKEYMEAYVAEDVAREQLAADPELRKQFEQKLRSDPAFAKDPAARLEFFARRHSSWDTAYQQYPVYKTAQIPKN